MSLIEEATDQARKTGLMGVAGPAGSLLAVSKTVDDAVQPTDRDAVRRAASDESVGTRTIVNATTRTSDATEEASRVASTAADVVTPDIPWWTRYAVFAALGSIAVMAFSYTVGQLLDVQVG